MYGLDKVPCQKLYHANNSPFLLRAPKVLDLILGQLTELSSCPHDPDGFLGLSGKIISVTVDDSEFVASLGVLLSVMFLITIILHTAGDITDVITAVARTHTNALIIDRLFIVSDMLPPSDVHIPRYFTNISTVLGNTAYELFVLAPIKSG